MTEPLKLFVFGIGDRVRHTRAWLEHCGFGNRKPFKGTILEWDKTFQMFMVQWDGIPGPSVVTPANIEHIPPPSRYDLLMEDAHAV